MVLANGLVNNVVLSRFLGLCSFMGVSNKIESAMGMAMATTFCADHVDRVGWVLEHVILQPLGFEYLRLLAFIMVIASLVQLTELFVAKQSPELHRTLGIFLPLITTNCAVLGIALLTVQEKLSFLETLVYGLSSRIGLLPGDRVVRRHAGAHGANRTTGTVSWYAHQLHHRRHTGHGLRGFAGLAG